MRYDGELQPCIDWVQQAEFKPAANAQARQDEPPAEFMAFARSVLPKDARFKFWSNVVTPQSHTAKGRDWIAGFPHVHAWGAGVFTLMCYLTDCEGGQIELAADKHMTDAKSVQPAPGVCVICDGDEWHGIRPVTAGERLAILVTAFRADYSRA